MGISHAHGEFPGSLTQAMLVGVMLSGRLGVREFHEQGKECEVDVTRV